MAPSLRLKCGPLQTVFMWTLAAFLLLLFIFTTSLFDSLNNYFFYLFLHSYSLNVHKCSSVSTSIFSVVVVVVVVMEIFGPTHSVCICVTFDF